LRLLKDIQDDAFKAHQEAEHERLWEDFVAGKVTSLRQVVRNYDLDPDKHSYWKGIFDRAAEDKLAQESEPSAKLEAYNIMAGALTAEKKLDEIDALVNQGRLTPEDGLKYRNQSKEYVLTPEQEAAYAVLRDGINFLIQDTADEDKKLEYTLQGSRAAEAFFTLAREGKSLEEIRQATLNMLTGPMADMLKDKGVLTKPPEKLTDREVFELEKTLEETAPEGRQPLALEQRNEQLAKIREFEQKAFDAQPEFGPMVDALYDEQEEGWIFFDRPIPRKADGSIDVETFQRGGYTMYKVEMVKKMGIRYVEFYAWRDGEWKKIGWDYLRRIEE